MLGTILAAAVVALLTPTCQAASLEDWRSRSIYQVMIDRYARTDGKTDVKCEPHLFCNGTWKGLMNKLDYIQDMGFTAVQISPVVENIKEDTSVGEAYHGYWPQNLYNTNDRFGSREELVELAAELHKRDMFLMVDVVINHMAQAFDNKLPPAVDYSKFNPFNDKKYFHDYCNVTMWENSTNIEQCWLYPYGVALADLKTESQPVVDMFSKWVKELVANFSIDGLRIDAAKHVNKEFLPTFIDQAGVFTFGEILTGVVTDFCPFQTKGLVGAMPNYLDWYKMIDVFNGGSFAALAKIRTDTVASCNDTTALGTFIENHDQPRFASRNPDMSLAQNALTYVLMNDGIPTVYQGQEQHMTGAETPMNREPLWYTGYNRSAPLYITAKKLNAARNNAIKLSAKDKKPYVVSLTQTLFVNDQHLCLRKGPQGSQLVFCIVNHSSKGPAYELSVGGFTAGDKVVEVLTCTSSQADATGNVTMYMNKGMPKVYTLEAAIKDTGICNQTQDAATASNNQDKAGAAPARLHLSLQPALSLALAWLLVIAVAL